MFCDEAEQVNRMSSTQIKEFQILLDKPQVFSCCSFVIAAFFFFSANKCPYTFFKEISALKHQEILKKQPVSISQGWQVRHQDFPGRILDKKP